MLNTDSLTRSVVGRTSCPANSRSLCPLRDPEIILMPSPLSSGAAHTAHIATLLFYRKIPKTSIMFLFFLINSINYQYFRKYFVNKRPIITVRLQKIPFLHPGLQEIFADCCSVRRRRMCILQVSMSSEMRKFIQTSSVKSGNSAPRTYSLFGTGGFSISGPI